MEAKKKENQGIADTHTHTRCSGFGKYSFLHFPESITEPAKAVKAARRKKLDVLCITDHNTVHGAIDAKKICNLELDGVEAFNAYHRDAYSNLMAQTLSPEKLARLGSSDAHSINMIGNGYTIFEGRTAEELHKSILNRKTSFGGSRTPLSECMSWSREIAFESIRMIFNSLKGEKSHDILCSAIDKTTKKTKALGLIGAALYIVLPFSYFFGVSGDIILNVKGKRKWIENKG